MENQALKLHITTPLGVVYDQFIKLLIIKIRDGYRGVNKNQELTIQKVKFGLIKIYHNDGHETETFLISNGVMKVEKFECQIFCDFLVHPKKIDDNPYLFSLQKIKKLVQDQNEIAFIVQKEKQLKQQLKDYRK